MNQPELAARIALSQLESSQEEYVSVDGTRKRFKIGFLHDYTVQKITELLLEREEIEKVARDGDSDDIMRSAVKHPYFSIKMVALAVLNSPFKIAVFYPFLWRWWAFARRFNEAQMASATMAIQKKNQGVLHDVLSDYHVLEGYEDGSDDDDEGGSRAVPSRTHAGRIAAFVKDFPCYGDTRWVPFAGRIINYTARCVLTIQQISLMQSDLPHTLYKRAGHGKGKAFNLNDKAFELQRLADEKAAARRKARQEKEGYTVDEVFRGDADKD